MGYTTDFTGSVSVDPPLNPSEIDYLTRFADSRRFTRIDGPYALHEDGFRGPRVIDYNRCPDGQPSLWCNWTPTADGTAIEWNGAEKFYDSAEWMQYVIDMFLKPGASLQAELADRVPDRFYDATFAAFTFDHTVSGTIEAQGEDDDDTWRLVVTGNQVERIEGATGQADAATEGAGTPTDLDEALRLLAEIVDGDDCWFDHHGGCQAHGFLSLEPGEKCPHAEAKELLARHGRSAG